ncbi:MAG: hypothetical protein M3Z04_12560 [Chloroflexota bacterium]|nr:hypothetical protein [Chloroflexota bacterium]
MPLTHLQRATLMLYRAYHANAPTVGGILRRLTKRYLIMLIVVVATLTVVTLTGSFSDALPWAGLLIGLVSGAAARDLGYARIAVRVWPVLNQVLDWQKIDALLAATSKGDTLPP